MFGREGSFPRWAAAARPACAAADEGAEPVSAASAVASAASMSAAPAASALQVYVSALRKLLGPSRIETSPAGYLLRLEAGELDLERFERLLAASRTAQSQERRSGLVSEALALFRGEPLADLRYEA